MSMALLEEISLCERLPVSTQSNQRVRHDPCRNATDHVYADSIEGTKDVIEHTTSFTVDIALPYVGQHYVTDWYPW